MAIRRTGIRGLGTAVAGGLGFGLKAGQQVLVAAVLLFGDHANEHAQPEGENDSGSERVILEDIHG